MSKLSIALSGGGHRATLFALGALQYVSDAGLNRLLDIPDAARFST